MADNGSASWAAWLELLAEVDELYRLGFVCPAPDQTGEGPRIAEADIIHAANAQTFN